MKLLFNNWVGSKRKEIIYCFRVCQEQNKYCGILGNYYILEGKYRPGTTLNNNLYLI